MATLTINTPQMGDIFGYRKRVEEVFSNVSSSPFLAPGGSTEAGEMTEEEYLFSTPANAQRLKSAMAKADRGEVTPFDLDAFLASVDEL